MAFWQYYPYINCYGGYYCGHPYLTNFETVNPTPEQIKAGTSVSSDLTRGAEDLTTNMHDGLDSCGEMMKNSSELSCEAMQLGGKFEKLITHFSAFSCDVKKFMGNMAYPDFELVTNPKPTFDETGVWANMNDDFERQIGKQEFLQASKTPEKGRHCSCNSRNLKCHKKDDWTSSRNMQWRIIPQCQPNISVKHTKET